MTTLEYLHEAEKLLLEAGIKSARLDALVIFEAALNKDRSQLIVDDTPIKKDLVDPFLTRRLSREPLAYIIGQKEFYGMDFKVTPDTLIPRPESEQIVDFAIGQVANYERIIDVGCGTGCLGISTTVATNRCKSLVMIDLSAKALATAKINAVSHGVEADFIQSDLLATTEINSQDLVLANLPYVPNDLQSTSEAEINHEPKEAIFVDGDGLDLYRKLFQQAKGSQASIITECLLQSLPALDSIAQDNGYEVEDRQDLVTFYLPA